MKTDDVDEFPSGEDPNRDGNLVGSDNLRKGPWTPEEDAILEDYVSKHGCGNWNAVQKVSGLLRCGKSCRLRWANHLRPDLKKGPFSSEEERLVIELHAKLGNKWARMAAKLPGRTDNEIKNFWNTRAKRLRRDGMSVYPPDVRVEIQSESQDSPESGTLSGNLRNSHSVMEPAELDIPEFQIQGHLNTGLYTSHSSIFSLQARNRRPKELGPGPGSLAFAYMSQPIGLGGQGQGSDMTLREAAYGPFIGQVNGMALEQHQAYVVPPLPEIYSNTEDQPLSFDPGSHALVNGGNYHVTCPTDFGHQKFELPSFQRSPDQFESSQINMPHIDQPEMKTTYDLEVLSEAEWKEVLAVSDPNACTQVGSLPGNSADDDPLPGPDPAGRTSSSSSNQTSIQQDPSDPDEWFNEYLLNLAKRQGKD